MRAFFVTVLLSFSLSVSADEANMPAEQKLALDYIHTITSNNIAKLASYYGRESVFQDKTANKKYVGRQHILEFFKRANKGLLEYRFILEHMFNSGNMVVMIGSYSYKGAGQLYGKPGKVINISVPGVTVLNVDVKNHRVKKHLDMIDYQTMKDQLEVQ